MIILKKLSWSNAFSYGADNSVDFSASPLTQIIGLNGHGKSSIALILEEVLYNKNSKGIKKADILNRNIEAKSYNITLEFEKDGVEYAIKSTRGSTQTVKLFRDGHDISAHTSTATYKLIEELVGYDHKTFTQIVYQSSSASLEFLTATDTNRKKFLIDLLNLTKYTDALEVFKAATKEVNDTVTTISAKISSVKSWLDKYSKQDLSIMELKEVPELPVNLPDETKELYTQLKNIDATNKKIVQNNKYKELRDSIVLDVDQVAAELSDISSYKVEIVENTKAIKDAEAFISKMNKLGSQCATCMQPIDADKVKAIISEHTDTIIESKNKLEAASKTLKELEELNSKYAKQQKNKQMYEEYHALYDSSISTSLVEKSDLVAAISANEAVIDQLNDLREKIIKHNNTATANNAKVEVIKAQMQDMKSELEKHTEDLAIVSEKHANLQILVKTFSPTGLVAYKIECLIKDLEEVTNTYLGELSSGRFQLSFRIASDKLNVVITDNGKDIDILALSSGERARVNVSALLGIRSLMQSLSDTRINLLILDETIENLDVEGKERLVEVLLSEDHLNTFLISHGFQHPLLEKIQVVKTHGISRIDNG